MLPGLMAVIWPCAFRDADECTFVLSMIHMKIGGKQYRGDTKNVERKLVADEESVQYAN